MLLEGLHIPLTTPFHADGRLNLRKLAANVERYSRTPAAGLIVLGPSGEPTLLNDRETREAMRAAANAAAAEKVLIAGISRDSVHATLELAEHAAELEYDAVLIAMPSVLAERGAGRLRELLTHFRVLADRMPLPIILLNVAGRVLPDEAVIELAAHSRMIALIDADRRARESDGFEQLVRLTAGPRREVTVTHTFAPVTARMQKAASAIPLLSPASLSGSAAAVAEAPAGSALRTRNKTVGFQIVAGDPSAMLDDLRAGAVGVAPLFAAAAPQACYEVYAAWKDNDQPLAEEKQARLVEAANQAESLGPGGLKFACDLNGYFGGLPRLPHLPPTGEQRATLEALMHPLRN